ncbi:protein DpdE [Spirulina sp. CS-785/01]|uniref:protein DpdE n=1 Tax=Spirulina sp. CS-785/01 TaxID=3021716 RepID=UPI00232DACD5|nr:protein DpdE [Spirulina sp. CS-785/01]MDB9314145.1 protein DpdE [Spirulina sp. CS-785/01]
MSIGALVRSRDNDLGIGKIVSAQDERATVKYFCSVGQQFTEEIPISQLRRVTLTEQTRCYLRLLGEKVWRVGRIFEWDTDEEQYRIDLPNGGTVLASEQEIFVRCNLPIEDPMDILAMKGQETPYFHNQRSRFVQSLVAQQATSRGLTGLLSANIELYPHQVEVVGQVLSDPIQRYWLADEPGLGKTVEAAVILRQFLLDNPAGKALIVVPPSLQQQWQQELEQKIYLSKFGERVSLLTLRDLDLRKLRESYQFVIFDQAEELAPLAYSSQATERERFGLYKQFAVQCDRLLLLSSLSPLSTPQQITPLLHLLDPRTYPLNSESTVQQQQKQRQKQGDFLLNWESEQAPSETQLKPLFPDDARVVALTDTPNLFTQHIRNTYRLHPRLLRNNRKAAEDILFDRELTPQTEYDLDERSDTLQEQLEQWRNAACESGNHQEAYGDIFWLFFRGSGTWLAVLKQLVSVRLNGKKTPDLKQIWGTEALKLLTETPHFDGETEQLNGLLNLLNEEDFLQDRLELLKILLLYHLADLLDLQSFKSDSKKLQDRIQRRIERPFSGDRFPKLVVFTQFTQTAQKLQDSLAKIFGKQTVVSYCNPDTPATREDNLQRFQKEAQCFFLVSDSSQLVGRNWQFVEGVVHFDLPDSPIQLEQRLRCFDCIGGKIDLKSWLLAGAESDASCQEAWYQLLNDSWDIFHQSLAPFQSYLEAKQADLKQLLFTGGAKGWLEHKAQLKEDFTQEQRKLQAYDALDTLDLDNETAQQYFQTLDDFDADHKTIKKATEGWLCGALQFQAKEDVNIKGAVHYHRSKNWRKPTLVALDELKRHFAPFLDRPSTYNRRTANKHPKLHLLRLGDGLMDTLENYLRWDDRGQAFALWRHDTQWESAPGAEWVGFRFDYRVTLEWEQFAELIPHGKHLIESCFSPRVETIFVDRQLQPVTQGAILAILQRPYSHKHSSSRDYNLAKERLPVIEQFVEAEEWEGLCQEARIQSEVLLRERLTSHCEQLAQQTEQRLDARLKELQQRQTHLGATSDTELGQEIEQLKALIPALSAAIKTPSLRPDSVGFIIVSGREVELESS